MTYFIYDGDESIEDRNSVGAVNASYIFGDRLDQVLTMERGSQKYFYHTDGLGSVGQITNASGIVVEKYKYDVFGDPDNKISTIGNRFKFTGREWDEESNTYYYRARQYHPKLGRFLQRDPIGYYDSNNLFQYVQNNPINFIDPFGEAGEELVLIPVFAWIPVVREVAVICGVTIFGVVLVWGIVDWILFSKGGKQNKRDSGLENKSDEEVTWGSKDKNIPKDQRERYKEEDKARRNRHKGGG